MACTVSAIGCRPTHQGRNNTLVYILEHESREATSASWQALGRDPDWVSLRQASGRLVTNVESLFLVPTDFAPSR